MSVPVRISVDVGWLARHLQGHSGTATLENVAREVIRQQALGIPRRFLREAVEKKLKEMVGKYQGFRISYSDHCLILVLDTEAQVLQPECPDYPPLLNQPALFTIPSS